MLSRAMTKPVAQTANATASKRVLRPPSRSSMLSSFVKLRLPFFLLYILQQSRKGCI